MSSPLKVASLALGFTVGAVGVAAADYEESPRTTVVEFRYGNYKPSIDEQFDTSVDQGPYADVFGGKDEALLMFGWEHHVLQTIGTISVGLGVGYWSVDGGGIAASGDATDSTTLRIVPMMGQIAYRLDVWRDAIPIVPALKLGLDYYVWDILDGADDTTSFAQGKPAEGGTWGWHYTLGAHLLLDALAPDMAADFDRDAGVNSSYITFEYQVSTVNDFGSDSSFRLGDDTFFVGVALEL